MEWSSPPSRFFVCLALALVTACCSASQATAQVVTPPYENLSTCPAGTDGNDVKVKVPERIAPGRRFHLTIEPALRAGDVFLQVASDDWVALPNKGSVDDNEASYVVDSPGEALPFDVKTRWPHWAKDWSTGLGTTDGLDCRMERVSTVQVNGKVGPFSFGDGLLSDSTGYALSGESTIDACQRLSLVPATVSVSSNGSTARLAFDDQCLRAASKPHTVRKPTFTAGLGAGASVDISPRQRRQRLVITISAGGKTWRWRTLYSFRTTPAVIYYEGSDAFFNYCLQRHRSKIRQKNGVRYCVKSGAGFADHWQTTRLR